MPLEKTIDKFRYLEMKGIIGKLKKLLSFTDEPHFFQYSCSYSENPYDEESGGIAIGLNENETKIRAMGECIERYSLQTISNPLIIDSFNNLNSNALDPGDFINFREQEMKNRKSEYLQKLRNCRISWVEGKDLKSNTKVLIPAQLVYVPFHKKEPIIRSQISTGAAAHENYEDAIIRGIFEGIERDAYMLKYLSKESSPLMILKGRLQKLEDYFKRYYLELKVFNITSDIKIPTFMCLNLDHTGEGPAVSVGLSSGFSSREAILKSIIESQQVRQWIRYSYIQDKKPKITHPSKIHSIKDRGYYWYPVERIKDLDFLHNGQYKKIPKREKVYSLKELIDYLNKKGIRSYVVDITPNEIREAGFNVVKVILPELHPLFLYENFPHFYSKRLEDRLKGRELNLVPHPFM